MKLSSVYAARTVWFVDIDELNPRGRRLFPELIPALIEAFGFSVFPETAAQMDPSAKTGIAFRNGKFNTGNDEMVAFDFEVHAAGLAVETKCSTAVSDSILQELAAWGIREFAVNFSPSMIRGKAHVSQLVFYPDKEIAKGLHKFNAFAEILSGTEIGGTVKKRELTNMYFKGDGSGERWAFTFERRADAPFKENKYFSLCDAPTDVHIGLLEKFEELLCS